MKSYCPYCGERSLSGNQRFMWKVWRIWLDRVKNKLWFSCPCCGKEVDKRTEVKGNKVYIFLIPSLIATAVAIFIFTVLKMNVAIYCACAVAAILAIMIGIANYKYSIFIRREASAEDDVIARANIDLKVGFEEEKIYIIRAKYKNKVNVGSMYIAALSNYSREDNTCDVRFIKPREAEGLIDAGKFEVYDDDKLVGSGEFIVG